MAALDVTPLTSCLPPPHPSGAGSPYWVKLALRPTPYRAGPGRGHPLPGPLPPIPDRVRLPHTEPMAGPPRRSSSPPPASAASQLQVTIASRWTVVLAATILDSIAECIPRCWQLRDSCRIIRQFYRSWIYALGGYFPPRPTAPIRHRARRRSTARILLSLRNRALVGARAHLGGGCHLAVQRSCDLPSYWAFRATSRRAASHWPYKPLPLWIIPPPFGLQEPLDPVVPISCSSSSCSLYVLSDED